MTIPHTLNLDSTFQIEQKNSIPFTKEKFPAGEVHIKLKETLDFVTDVMVVHRIRSFDDVMEVLLATDALHRKYDKPERDLNISLYMPYIMFGRQDRAMVTGEPFSLKVFANLINSQNYRKVYTVEPHSDVTSALFNKLEVLTPYYLLKAQEAAKKEFGEFVLLAPDGGSLKRIYKQAEFMNYKGQVLCASKIRDLNTGNILRTTIDTEDNEIKGKTIFISDDLCSRGGTFCALAKVLKGRGAANVALCVAHYEGTANEEKLKEGGLARVYCTNSMLDYKSDFVKQFSL